MSAETEQRNRQHLVLSPKHYYCSHCGTDHNSALELRAVRPRASSLGVHYQLFTGSHRSSPIQHVEHVAAHANWRQDHEADAGWIGCPTASVGPAKARSSPEDESLLSIFDCYGDRSLYHSLRVQFRTERGLGNYSTAPDAPV
jgi:hypothetical protein